MEAAPTSFANKNCVDNDEHERASFQLNDASHELENATDVHETENLSTNGQKVKFFNQPSMVTVRSNNGYDADYDEYEQQSKGRQLEFEQNGRPPIRIETETKSVGDDQIDERDEPSLTWKQNHDVTVNALPFLDFDKEIDFDDILRLINPFGPWQKTLSFIACILGAWPYVLLPAFIGIKVPHYCRVPALSNTTWTLEQIRNLTIPYKHVDSPPAIGQAYEPCRYFDLPYEEVARFSSAEEAFEWRGELARNSTNGKIPTLSCDNGWNYDTDAVQFKSSIQIDFNMVCKHEPLLQLSLSTYMVGMLLGVITFGAISDRFGRRKGALVSGFLLVPVLIAIPLSTSNLLYTVSRFWLAFLLNGHFICMYVLVMEIVGPKYRAAVGFWQNIPFYIGYSLLAPMAYGFRDSWRWLHAVQSWPLIMLPVFWLMLPESPRWLITQGRYWEARVILEHAARRNGKWPLPVTLGPDLLRRCRRRSVPSSLRRTSATSELQEVSAKMEVIPDVRVTPPTPTPAEEMRKSRHQRRNDSANHRRLQEKPSFFRRANYGLTSAAVCLRLLKTPELRQRTVLSCFLWFSICAVYYGMAFYSVRLYGDIFVNFFLMGIVALPAYALSWLVYQRFGRKPPLIAVLVLCGLFCCAIAAIDAIGKYHDWHVLVLICATAGKFFMTGAFGMIYVYSAEIFPTVVRNVGISSNSMVARLGSAFAPYVNDISDFVWHPLPMLIYGILSIFTAITTMLLPETDNKDLVETIEDIEHERLMRHRASIRSRQQRLQRQATPLGALA